MHSTQGRHINFPIQALFSHQVITSNPVMSDQVEQVTEAMLNSKLTQKEKDEAYFTEQCYDVFEFKELVEVKGAFGSGAKLLTAKWAGRGVNKKLCFTIKLSSGEEKIFPLKAHINEDKTFINKRSVKFFTQRLGSQETDDLKAILGA